MTIGLAYQATVEVVFSRGGDPLFLAAVLLETTPYALQTSTPK